MVAIRDLKCSMDIAEMAALGKFEQEFIVYGCCYVEQGKTMYRVSTQAIDIYRFWERCLEKDIYPSPVIRLLNRVLVPSGMQESYLFQTRIRLARKIQAMYPQQFLFDFMHTAVAQSNDSAAALFYQLQQQMIGCFDRDILQLVEGLIVYAYQQKKLKQQTYQDLQQWVNDLYRQMEDDVVMKQNFQRTFFGFAYYDARQKLHYYTNAQESDVYEKREALLCQGILPTPIVQKTYYYVQQPDLRTVKEAFVQQMERWLDEEYWQYLTEINRKPAVVSQTQYQKLLQYAERENGQGMQQYLQLYRCLWQVAE